MIVMKHIFEDPSYSELKLKGKRSVFAHFPSIGSDASQNLKEHSDGDIVYPLGRISHIAHFIQF